MNANNSLRYYVYGLELQDGSIFEIGVTNQDPDSRKAGIFSTPSNGDPERFTIEDFPTLEAAQEALSFWLNYFRFLGLKALKLVN